MFWRHRSPSTVIYTTFFLKVQTVWRKTIVFEVSKKSTRKFWIFWKINYIVLDFQKNPWYSFGFFCALAGRAQGDSRRGVERGREAYDFSWDVVLLAGSTYDSRREVLTFTSSTLHFMVCFEHWPEKVVVLWCVLKAPSTKYCNLRDRFSGISDSMA